MTRISHIARSRFALLAVMLLFAGCLEYETTTTVHPDGSFTRAITVTGDSTSVYGWHFKIPADSTWTILERTRVDDKKWTMKAERTFGSNDAWTIWKKDLDRRVLESTVTIERDFRFFTTRYRYTETIRSYNPFTLIPVTDYISQTELDMFLRFEVMKESYPSKGDSLALDDAGDRFQEWETRTHIESFYQALAKGLASDSRFDSTRLAAVKQSMLDYFLTEASKNDYTTTGMRRWAKTFKDPAVLKAIDDNAASFDALKEDIDFVSAVGGDSYVSRVDLPGELISTNGKRDGVHTALWDNYIAYAYVQDFTMTAESSLIHIWAIALTVGVIIGLPILLWAVRRRRMTRAVSV